MISYFNHVLGFVLIMAKEDSGNKLHFLFIMLFESMVNKNCKLSITEVKI